MFELLSNNWVLGIGTATIAGLVLYYIFGIGRDKGSSGIKAGGSIVAGGDIVVGNKKVVNKSYIRPKKWSDKSLLEFYVQCFNRPVFQDSFRQEGSMEDFIKAIEDTITALNTGVLASRDNVILKKAEGITYIKDKWLQDQLFSISKDLNDLKRRYRTAIKNKEIKIWVNKNLKNNSYCFNSNILPIWFDNKRMRILEKLNHCLQRFKVKFRFSPYHLQLL